MVKIAFCPTMTPYAEKIMQYVDNVEMIPMGSAAQVLSMLMSGVISGVLIGRYAKENEIDKNTKKEILKNGYTLVYKFKTGINENELSRIEIKTYLKKEEIENLVPLFGKITFYSSYEKCFADGLDIPALIDWKDWDDTFELLIPMNNEGKTPVFRAPVLYYKDIDTNLIERIKDTV